GAEAGHARHGRSGGARAHPRRGVRGAYRRARERVRPGKPRGAAGGVRVRLLEVLREEPEAVSGPGGHGSGFARAGDHGARRGPQDRRPEVSGLRARGDGGGARGNLAPLAGRPGGVPDRVQLHVRSGAHRRGLAHRARRAGPERPDVRYGQGVRPVRTLLGAYGREHAAVQGGGDTAGGEGVGALPGDARRPLARRGPGGFGDQGPKRAGVRRAGRDRGGSATRVLGLRRNAPGRRDEGQAAARDHAQPWPHVYHRPSTLGVRGL
ncbi:MAG: UPF0317 protein YcsI, partial [uncultured Rubrobacteraceae bacterium]